MNIQATLLVVNDLATSSAFYQEALGANIIEEYSDSIRFSLGEHHLYMFEGTLDSKEYNHGYNANSTLIIGVDNLDKRIEELKDMGVEFVHKTPNSNRWGRYAAFKDPSGIVHELMEFTSE